MPLPVFDDTQLQEAMRQINARLVELEEAPAPTSGADLSSIEFDIVPQPITITSNNFFIKGLGLNIGESGNGIYEVVVQEPDAGGDEEAPSALVRWQSLRDIPVKPTIGTQVNSRPGPTRNCVKVLDLANIDRQEQYRVYLSIDPNNNLLGQVIHARGVDATNQLRIGKFALIQR